MDTSPCHCTSHETCKASAVGEECGEARRGHSRVSRGGQRCDPAHLQAHLVVSANHIDHVSTPARMLRVERSRDNGL